MHKYAQNMHILTIHTTCDAVAPSSGLWQRSYAATCCHRWGSNLWPWQPSNYANNTAFTVSPGGHHKESDLQGGGGCGMSLGLDVARKTIG